MHDRFMKWSNGGNGIRVLWLVLLAACALAAPCAYSASNTALVLGDSLSAEYGLAHGSGWVALLEKRLQQDNIDTAIVNASISGETTSGGKTRIKALLAQYHPTLVLIELGANDGLRGLALNATQDNLRAIIKAAQDAHARVVLLGMQIPPNYGIDYTRQFAGMYPKLAKETHAALVPFFLASVANSPELFQPDRLHPTAAAQPLILETVWPHLQPLLQSPVKN